MFGSFSSKKKKKALAAQQAREEADRRVLDVAEADTVATVLTTALASEQDKAHAALAR